MNATTAPLAPHTPVPDAFLRQAKVRRWPLLFIGAPAAVAVWSGWVGLGGMCGFGIVHPLPGIADSFQLNTAITLPVGIEAYGMYALGAWLNPGVGGEARRFAKKSGIGSLVLGMCGQIIYHLLAAAHQARAPWPVVVLVSCLPVIALGLGTALAHMMRAAHDGEPEPVQVQPAVPEPLPVPVPEAVPVRETVPVRPALDVPEALPGLQPVRHQARTGDDASTETAATEPVRDQEDTAPRTGGEAPAPETGGGDGPAPLAELPRDVVVGQLADEIRDAVDAGTVWKPDYVTLMTSTGKRRSWCEKVVRDARNLVLDPGGETAVEPRADDDGPRLHSVREEEDTPDTDGGETATDLADAS